MPQLILGCHLSSSKGFLALGRNALHIGANTFQFFTRNPRGSKAKPLDLPDAQALRTLMAAHGFGPVLAHAPYTLTPARRMRACVNSRWRPWRMILAAWRRCPAISIIFILAAM